MKLKLIAAASAFALATSLGASAMAADAAMSPGPSGPPSGSQTDNIKSFNTFTQDNDTTGSTIASNNQDNDTVASHNALDSHDTVASNNTRDSHDTVASNNTHDSHDVRDSHEVKDSYNATDSHDTVASNNNNGNDRNKLALSANVLLASVSDQRFGGDTGLGLGSGGDVTSGAITYSGGNTFAGIATQQLGTGQGSLGQAATSISASANVSFQ